MLYFLPCFFWCVFNIWGVWAPLGLSAINSEIEAIYHKHSLIRLPNKKIGMNREFNREKHHLFEDPYPYGGGRAGGDRTNLSKSTFFAWKPWDSDQNPQMDFLSNIS